MSNVLNLYSMIGLSFKTAEGSHLEPTGKPTSIPPPSPPKSRRYTTLQYKETLVSTGDRTTIPTGR